jgi:uncharacterized phage-associated protein
MLKTYTAGHIANYMLDAAEREERPVSPMKLLKLVYLGYGWGLAILNRKFFDEAIYAWAHGPVIRSLYDEFKHFGKNAIDGRSVELDLEKMDFVEPRIDDADNDVNLVLGKVWGTYKKFSAWDLRNITHESDSPWSQVYRPDMRNIEIPDALIKEHFKKKITTYLQNAG